MIIDLIVQPQGNVDEPRVVRVLMSRKEAWRLCVAIEQISTVRTTLWDLKNALELELRREEEK